MKAEHNLLLYDCLLSARSFAGTIIEGKIEQIKFMTSAHAAPQGILLVIQ